MVDLFRFSRHDCHLPFESINLLDNRFCQGFNLVLVHLGQGFNLVLVCLLLVFHCLHQRFDKVRQGLDLCTGTRSLLL